MLLMRMIILIVVVYLVSQFWLWFNLSFASNYWVIWWCHDAYTYLYDYIPLCIFFYQSYSKSESSGYAYNCIYANAYVCCNAYKSTYIWLKPLRQNTVEPFQIKVIGKLSIIFVFKRATVLIIREFCCITSVLIDKNASVLAVFIVLSIGILF